MRSASLASGTARLTHSGLRLSAACAAATCTTTAIVRTTAGSVLARVPFKLGRTAKRTVTLKLGKKTRKRLAGRERVVVQIGAVRRTLTLR